MVIEQELWVIEDHWVRTGEVGVTTLMTSNKSILIQLMLLLLVTTALTVLIIMVVILMHKWVMLTINNGFFRPHNCLRRVFINVLRVAMRHEILRQLLCDVFAAQS